MSSPCQDCPYRKLRCHDRCNEYIEWHDALVEAKSKVKAAFDAIEFLDQMAQKRARKVRMMKRK